MVRGEAQTGSIEQMKVRPLLLLALGLSVVAAERDPLPPDHGERLTRGLELFQKSVRSILVNECLKCHGGEQTKGDFDLSTRDGLLKGGADGQAVKLYDSSQSRLLKLIRHEARPHMPSKGDKLSEEAIGQIATWIELGAPYDRPLLEGKGLTKRDRSKVSASDREWWAFQPLKSVPVPKVDGTKTDVTAIDAFILARLEEKKLQMNPTADRRTLIRRASLELLGLPPTPEQVAEFERDTSTNAWQTVITTLLDSPRYGERWARHWLDVARFAESSGFEHDYDRPNAYHFRDFVIKVLNSDMPYDQFVRWQLAGDEFEPDNPLALMATGFLGAGVFPTQITANEVERTRYDAMDDMLSTTGTAMLGLTIGCARCHDHKFDPIPTRDYYRMLATFTTTVRSDIEVDLQPEKYRREKEEFDLAHADVVAELRKYEAEELPAKFDAWLDAGARVPRPARWKTLEMIESTSKAGATFTRLEDESYLAAGENGASDIYTFVAEIGDQLVRALRLEALPHPTLKKGGPGRADNGNIGLSRIRVFALVPDGGRSNEVKLVNPRATFEQNTGALSIASALDNNPKTGWAVDPRFGTNHAAAFGFAEPLQEGKGTRLVVKLEFELNTRHNIGRTRLAISSEENLPLDEEAMPASVARSLAEFHSNRTSHTSLSAAARADLLKWWKRTDPGWRAIHDKVEAHAKLAPKLSLTKVLVCAEGFPPLRMNTQGADFFQETHLLDRGSTDSKREVAKAGFLQVLLPADEQEERWRWEPPVGAKFSGRRRALANWMTDAGEGAGHLLARVVVNRIWQHHFGQGLVDTPNDFGAQGAKPSHPELLDWLATELIRGGWRLKPIHRLILSSAVYRQNCQADAAKAAIDPANLLYSRRTPRRLEAEAIRDSHLFVSGILDTNMFGPGTLDPASLRRSIYFTVKRSQLVGAMQVFDAPEPLVSQGFRQTTTVAPQALLLMNSPHVRSWATAFAKRISSVKDRPTTAAMVTAAYDLALNRPPTPMELTEASTFLEKQTAGYRAEESPNPEDQALTDFAQVILNLNEFMYVE